MSVLGPENAGNGLSVIVFSREFERVHYALVLASTAAAIGRPATLFFAGSAVRALVTAAADGAPSWQALPTADGGSAATVDDGFRHRGIATFEILLSACAELGVRFLVCEMALRAAGIEAADLRDDVPFEVAGAATLLSEAGTLVTL